MFIQCVDDMTNDNLVRKMKSELHKLRRSKQYKQKDNGLALCGERVKDLGVARPGVVLSHMQKVHLLTEYLRAYVEHRAASEQVAVSKQSLRSRLFRKSYNLDSYAHRLIYGRKAARF